MNQTLFAVREDTTWIGTPISGINSNGNWIVCNGLLDICSSNSLHWFWFVGSSCYFAGLVLSLIWISRSSCQTMSCSPSDSLVFPTSITAFRISITINQLLFWKFWCWSTFLNSEHWFDCTDCWECPTWTTITLILYFCQCRPVDFWSSNVCWDEFLKVWGSWL